MQPLTKFLKLAERTSHLSREQRLRIVEQALLLIEMNYVHLPLKQAMHAVNPIQLLKLLKFRLETKTSALEPVMNFHSRLLAIFASLRDVHTSYYLPAPFAFQVAFLPFLVEQCFESGGPHHRIEKFLVSRVMPPVLADRLLAGSSAAFFEPGVEALYWNGVPIQRAIELNGQNQAGSNPAARLARGLDNLTVRPLDAMLPPDEKWVDLTYRSKSGEELTQRFEWRVYDSTNEPAATASENEHAAIDIKKMKTNQFRKTFFAQPPPVGARRARQAFKQNFYTETRIVGGRKYGYVRLFSFEATNKNFDRFVKEVARVITEDFPQEGLILDVRGNPGGLIRAGERLLQLFTSRRIKPEPFQFINTPLNLEICQRAPKSYGLDRWIPSIAESVQTGAIYSMGFPLQSEDSCNAIGQVYYGPVVLITDALSYSTTDIFAAGFQDHKIGTILGTSDNTGAGGANKWAYDELVKVLGKRGNARFKPLPNQASFDLALRRSVRVGESEGRPLEELGITPDHRHYMTKRDLMTNNVDLVRKAARLLQAKPIYSLFVEPAKNRNALRIAASSKAQPRDKRKRISRVDVSTKGRPHKSLSARNGNLPRTIVLLGNARGKRDWSVQAYDYDNNLVAVARRH